MAHAPAGASADNLDYVDYLTFQDKLGLGMLPAFFLENAKMPPHGCCLECIGWHRS